MLCMLIYLGCQRGHHTEYSYHNAGTVIREGTGLWFKGSSIHREQAQPLCLTH